MARLRNFDHLCNLHFVAAKNFKSDTRSKLVDLFNCGICKLSDGGIALWTNSLDEPSFFIGHRHRLDLYPISDNEHKIRLANGDYYWRHIDDYIYNRRATRGASKHRPW